MIRKRMSTPEKLYIIYNFGKDLVFISRAHLEPTLMLVPWWCSRWWRITTWMLSVRCSIGAPQASSLWKHMSCIRSMSFDQQLLRRRTRRPHRMLLQYFWNRCCMYCWKSLWKKFTYFTMFVECSEMTIASAKSFCISFNIWHQAFHNPWDLICLANYPIAEHTSAASLNPD